MGVAFFVRGFSDSFTLFGGVLWSGVVELGEAVTFVAARLVSGQYTVVIPISVIFQLPTDCGAFGVF